MADAALAALFKTLRTHLINQGDWQSRLGPLEVLQNQVSIPYCAYYVNAQTRVLSVPRRNHQRIVVGVRAAANTLAAALAMQEQISELLHNSGSQDVDPRLPSHAEWHILTVTEERALNLLPVRVEGSIETYHAGYLYGVMMELI